MRKRFLSAALVLITMFTLISAFTIPASAATGRSSQYNAFSTKSIVVVTNKSGSPSMKFKCVGNGSFQYGAKAPKLSLRVYNHHSGSTQYYRITGAGNTITSTLRLSRNTTYTITVSYIYDSLNRGTFGSGIYRTTGYYPGTWYVTSTNALSYAIR